MLGCEVFAHRRPPYWGAVGKDEGDSSLQLTLSLSGFTCMRRAAARTGPGRYGLAGTPQCTRVLGSLHSDQGTEVRVWSGGHWLQCSVTLGCKATVGSLKLKNSWRTHSPAALCSTAASKGTLPTPGARRPGFQDLNSHHQLHEAPAVLHPGPVAPNPLHPQKPLHS